jgi:hypothetical protein
MMPLSDPSPLTQTVVYMLGILAGYALLTPAEDWSRAWETVRSVWRRDRR